VTAALHLLDGRWVASCPDCGAPLAQAAEQPEVEEQAGPCPVCHPAPDVPLCDLSADHIAELAAKERTWLTPEWWD
jgi:hypothetical protein